MIIHQMDVITAFLNRRDLYEATRQLYCTRQGGDGVQAKEIPLRIETVSQMLEQSIS